MKTNNENLIPCDSMVIGETYPVYGMITGIVSEVPGQLTVKINNSINAVFPLNNKSDIELVKSRAFEPCIFVSKVVQDYPMYVVNVTTVIFGPSKGAAN